MDPTELLRQLRVSVRLAREATSESERDGHRRAVLEGFEGLDQWFSRGGFPPAQWGNLTTKDDDDDAPRWKSPAGERDVARLRPAGWRNEPGAYGDLSVRDAILAELEPNPWRGPRFAGGITAAEVLGQVRGDD